MDGRKMETAAKLLEKARSTNYDAEARALVAKCCRLLAETMAANKSTHTESRVMPEPERSDPAQGRRSEAAAAAYGRIVAQGPQGRGNVHITA